jgi:uncharacterized membrane protein
MSTTPDRLVERYVKHLEVELDDLPRDRRREIVDEIAGHIAEARAALEHETEADVRNILEGLGDPADIAEDARERFEVQPPAPAAQHKVGLVEVGALVMLLVGGLMVPIVGWLIGVVLLWVSNAWNVRDKVIGTLFVPGGLALPLFLFLLTASLAGGSAGCPHVINLNTGREVPQSCPNGDASSTPYFGIAAAIALVLIPILTTIYLAYRLRNRPAAATA